MDSSARGSVRQQARDPARAAGERGRLQGEYAYIEYLFLSPSLSISLSLSLSRTLLTTPLLFWTGAHGDRDISAPLLLLPQSHIL
tara:strand:+ start:928 stop:1182 length:255 start_codon:yes stop_codon:yes gene_type:complete